MNCQTVRDQLVDHWDQPHVGQTDQRLQGHLQQCGACRQLAAEYTLSYQLVHNLPEVEPAENFEWRLRLRLNQIDKDGFVDPLAAMPASRRMSSLQFAGSAAAAAVVVLAVGFFSLRVPDSGLRNSAPASQDLAQEIPAATGFPEASIERNASGDGAAVAQLHWTTDRDRPRLPNLAPTRPDFLQVVPVSAGVPFGPEAMTPPAPSILGTTVPLPVPLPR